MGLEFRLSQLERLLSGLALAPQPEIYRAPHLRIALCMPYIALPRPARVAQHQRQPKTEDENMLKSTDWNLMVIQVKDDEITNWLNGRQMVYLKDQKIGEGKGFIALQIHDGGGIKVRWKNIRIKQLK